MKNITLVACAIDIWDDVDCWRFTAEHSHRMCLNDATRKKDVGSLNVLLRLRRSSKKLAKDVVAMVEMFTAMAEPS
ncbi:MAG: hypothetical protein EOO61_19085 [Hymenobacter sp.]|nr:MAG: hypothetical protein EOO61_19085 [Hymenobacter sp.]